jgi:hypothetical protein
MIRIRRRSRLGDPAAVAVTRPKIILDEVVALDRLDAADCMPLVRCKPWVPFQAQVPKMMMRINDTAVVGAT